MHIKALSIRQPWASLIVEGTKDIENRSRGTPYRGPLLIHAAKNLAPGYRDQAKSSPRGGFIGIAQLVAVVRESASPWFTGPVGYHLIEARGFALIKAPGRLALWEVDVDQVEGLRDQLASVA